MTGAWKLGQPVTVTLEDLATGETGVETLPLGRIAWSTPRRAAVFEPSGAAIAARIPLSPHALRLDEGLVAADPAAFDGLHGVFADSLPDGWGTLLVDREAEARGVRRGDLTAVDRLAVVGTSGMGALTFRPELAAPERDAPDLTVLARTADRVLAEAGEVALADAVRLRGALGGSGGARPKIVCQIGEGDSLRAATAPPDPRFGHWIVKFATREDGPDMAAIEQAYATMARAAGIDMAESRVVTGSEGTRFFAVRRFDREVVAGQTGAAHGGTLLRRWHRLSAAGALESDPWRHALDYSTLLTWIARLTRDHRAVEEGFRRAAFNVMAHNRDDHGRQHSALLDRDKAGAWRWRLSPAYDLTPSWGPNGEHSLTVGGLGREVDAEALGRLAADSGVVLQRRDAILAEVAAAVATWPDHAEAAEVPRSARERVAQLHVLRRT